MATPAARDLLALCFGEQDCRACVWVAERIGPYLTPFFNHHHRAMADHIDHLRFLLPRCRRGRIGSQNAEDAVVRTIHEFLCDLAPTCAWFRYAIGALSLRVGLPLDVAVCCLRYVRAGHWQ